MFEAEVRDRDSARQAEIERLKNGGSDDLQKTIGWGTLILLTGMLCAMIFIPEIIDNSKEMFYTAFGAVSGYFAHVVSYYFGASHKK